MLSSCVCVAYWLTFVSLEATNATPDVCCARSRKQTPAVPWHAARNTAACWLQEGFAALKGLTAAYPMSAKAFGGDARTFYARTSSLQPGEDRAARERVAARCWQLRRESMKRAMLQDLERTKEFSDAQGKAVMQASLAHGVLCPRSRRAEAGLAEPQITARGLALAAWSLPAWARHAGRPAASGQLHPAGGGPRSAAASGPLYWRGANTSHLSDWILYKDAHFTGVVASLVTDRSVMVVDAHCGCIELRISAGTGPALTAAEVWSMRVPGTRSWQRPAARTLRSCKLVHMHSRLFWRARLNATH